MNYECIEQLTKMKLQAMRDEYKRQEELPYMATVSFDERFAAIVLAQFNKRVDSRIARSLKEAELRNPSATLEHLDFQGTRSKLKPMIAQLSNINWAREGRGIIATGATGTGKTYILCAFGRAACIQGYKVKYYRVPRLCEMMKNARTNGNYEKMISSLKKPDILIFDDFGLKEFDNNFSIDLLEIMDERDVAGKSILIGAQLPVRLWSGVFQNKTACDGFMDRVVNKTYRLELEGRSMRSTAPEHEWKHNEHKADESATEDM